MAVARSAPAEALSSTRARAVGGSEGSEETEGDGSTESDCRWSWSCHWSCSWCWGNDHADGVVHEWRGAIERPLLLLLIRLPGGAGLPSIEGGTRSQAETSGDGR